MTTVASSILTLMGVAIAIAKKKGVPDSISEIAYIIPHWAFSVWIAMVAILLMPGMMDCLPVNKQWMGFSCVVGALIVASSSFYKTEAKRLHYIGGCACAVFAIIVTIILQPVLSVLIGIFLLVMAVLGSKEWLFWVETIIYVVLTISILTQ